MNKLFKYFDWLISFLFGICIFFFFSVFYQHHLHYQEQFQLFLFTSDYWSDLMKRPGGLADYLGTFFTQFYYYSWLGAFIIAFLLVLLQIIIRRICKLFAGYSSLFLPITFIPSIFIWGILCDENNLLSIPISVILSLLPFLLYLKIKNPVIRIIYIFLCLPILYWLAGSAFFVFVPLCVFSEWTYFKQIRTWQFCLLLVFGIVLSISLPLMSSLFLQYPMKQLWWGISYNRYPVVSPYPMLIMWSSVVLVPLFTYVVRNTITKIKSIKSFSFIGIVVLSIFSISTVKLFANWKKEEVMAYDYYTRTQNWKKIIDMANHKDPDSPLSVTCLNLALYKDGSMGNSMFRYFQNGPEGLLPAFQRDFTSPLISGEVYYHLGFLNTSMRYSFEAMEALPDFKKSSRAILRLAEVNLLNGDYKVAQKYLCILQHTLFYRDVAEKMLSCLGDEKKIDENPEWASLRKYRMKSDFLFSENEKDQMLGLLFVNNQTNKMAFEYLMAYTLLIKDMEHFVTYFPLGRSLGYKEIPSHYQEALVFYWINTGHTIATLPWSIDSAVVQNYIYFSKALASNTNKQTLYRQFSQTYWYYLQFAGGDLINYTQNPIY